MKIKLAVKLINLIYIANNKINIQVNIFICLGIILKIIIRVIVNNSRDGIDRKLLNGTLHL
jgi:hypothetical protein